MKRITVLSVVCFLVSASVWTVYAVSPTEKQLSPRAKAGSLTVTGAGDAFMVQRFPADYQIDPKLRDWIVSADARVVNFEAVVNDGSCPPAAWSGGTHQLKGIEFYRGKPISCPSCRGSILKMETLYGFGCYPLSFISERTGPSTDCRVWPMLRRRR